MAPMKHTSTNYSSNHYGEAVVPTRRADVLASCYMTNSFGSLKGFHYCTTGATGLPSPPSSPPLAAITSSNTVALLSKSSRGTAVKKSSSKRARGGATLIREECERFFCETMQAVFHGERNTACGSGVMSVDMFTPPDDDENLLDQHHRQSAAAFNNKSLAVGGGKIPPCDSYFRNGALSPPVPCTEATAWMEIWDFANGPSLRAFVADDGEEKSLFVFLHDGIIGREMKHTLVAIIELAEGYLECSSIVLCIERSIPEEESQGLMKNLQWVGFELTTLDKWAQDIDTTTSRQWLYMGMEV
ncbi:hypothetical protein MKZ38_001058 [Zalerion maritima]|uniref:Ornithine decarboxylase antizyme n=1 Tax=Zalerion maritima TaxID=339359 RepID=A0AAD5RQQ7_9PEZI|nr:hypothetical protein MKZ38_001058 [Zalerion maritima]